MDTVASHHDDLALLKAGKLKGCKHLKLACNLTEFPPEIFDLADSLEILDLSNNRLSTLPDDFNRLHRLRILFCSFNQFTALPDVLGASKTLSMIGFKANKIAHVAEGAIPTQTLRWLILTDNSLKSLPQSLGHCKQLQKLMLAGNQLSQLPETLARCQNLELLRISANHLSELPSWLFTLPRLAWLAYAGNLISESREQDVLMQHATARIDWHELELQQLLGQGASGLTYQAIWNEANKPPQTVAVKLFKSGLTSDGLPQSEMAANILADSHVNLVGLKGIIHNHPEGTLGLVMPLLETKLSVLAGPPSFESCSRDVYQDSSQYTPAVVLNIIKSVANAALHMHQRGIMHGDLYAHNILYNDHHAVLSDLGGASCLPLDDEGRGQKLQQIESLAFGILLEELLHRCTMDHNAATSLWQLQQDCCQPTPAARPLFDDIYKRLSAIQ
ncbi:MAG TPA: leucine-rich repeat-containing protein kinase family protein [Methylophilaceae bacterium]